MMDGGFHFRSSNYRPSDWPLATTSVSSDDISCTSALSESSVATTIRQRERKLHIIGRLPVGMRGSG